MRGVLLAAFMELMSSSALLREQGFGAYVDSGAQSELPALFRVRKSSTDRPNNYQIQARRVSSEYLSPYGCLQIMVQKKKRRYLLLYHRRFPRPKGNITYGWKHGNRR